MVGHGGSSAGSYLADPTSPIPSHCASVVATSTARVNSIQFVRHIPLVPLFFNIPQGLDFLWQCKTQLNRHTTMLNSLYH